MEKVDTGHLNSVSAHDPGQRARDLVDLAATIIKSLEETKGRELSDFEIKRRAINALEQAGVFKTLGVSREVLFPEVQALPEEILLGKDSKN